MKFTSFKPYGFRCVLKLDTPEQVTDGGIIIPDSVQRPSTTATVISFGDKCEKVREGIRIIIPKEIADGVPEIMIGEQKYIMVLEDMIDGEIS